MKSIKTYYQHILLLFILTIFIVFKMLNVTRFTEAASYFSMPLFFVFLVIFFVSLILKQKTNHIIETIHEWVMFISVSLSFILLIFSFIMIPSNVNQQSMMPTLNDGDRIIISHFMYEPKRHDIIVVEVNQSEYPMIPTSTFQDDDTVYFVKRLVGLPGDKISFVIENGLRLLYINDQKVLSVSGHAYVVTEQQQQFLETQIQNQTLMNYFVLGDNSQASLDSIEFGCISLSDIMGKVVFRLWPFGGVYE